MTWETLGYKWLIFQVVRLFGFLPVVPLSPFPMTHMRNSLSEGALSLLSAHTCLIRELKSAALPSPLQFPYTAAICHGLAQCVPPKERGPAASQCTGGLSLQAAGVTQDSGPLDGWVGHGDHRAWKYT